MSDWVKTERCNYSFCAESDTVVPVESAVQWSLEHCDYYHSGELERVSTKVDNCIEALSAVVSYLVDTATPEQRDACERMLDSALNHQFRSTRTDKDN